jgi:hypothetical protein
LVGVSQNQTNGKDVYIIVEILALMFALISGGCLLAIQLRRPSRWSMGSFLIKEAREDLRSPLDSFDKKLLLTAILSFFVFIILVVNIYT